MRDELAFVQYAIHRELLTECLAQAQSDPEVVGCVLLGSVARGDAYPGSDLDLLVLLAPGCSRPFQAGIRQDVLVEIHYADFAQARAKLADNPMHVYRYLDGRILYDRSGDLVRLRELAWRRFDTYTVPVRERQGIAHGLQSVKIKALAAREGGDLLKAAYIATTQAFEILVGLWAINAKPCPPGGAVLAHVSDLQERPPHLEQRLRELFLGDPLERIAIFVALIDWAVPRLEGDPPQPTRYHGPDG